MPWLAGVLQEAATGGDNTGFTRCGETVRRVFKLAHVGADAARLLRSNARPEVYVPPLERTVRCDISMGTALHAAANRVLDDWLDSVASEL